MCGCHRAWLLVLAFAIQAGQDAPAGEFPVDPLLTPFLTPPYAAALCLDETSIDCQPSGTADPEVRDRAGLRRDTWYFLGYQVVTIGILYMMPESVSSWSDEQKEDYSLSIWWDNVTHPAWDGDDYFINYVLHPYWGAAYYVRARERGYSGTQSFWYSALLSSAYEFGAEALFERPSIQDLVSTPVGGALVGRYFMKIRTGIREREASQGYRSTRDKWLWVLTDPLGSINGQFDRLFGWDKELQFRPYVSELRYRTETSPGVNSWHTERVIGIRFQLAW